MEDIGAQLQHAADLLQKSVFDLAGRIVPGDVSQLVLAAATAERIAGRLTPDRDPDREPDPHGTKT